MNFFSLLYVLLFSCSAKKHVDLETAKSLFSNAKDCTVLLKKHMVASHCPKLSYTSASPYDIMFRCHKPDSHRGEFWDNYIFRVSPKDLVYASEEDRKLVDKHTICVDSHIRLEAYPPDAAGYYNGS